ncbi:hypothetical protein HMPREF0294_2101, partial [Corynebacterium glucuronolyticum ATCC 51867]
HTPRRVRPRARGRGNDTAQNATLSAGGCLRTLTLPMLLAHTHSHNHYPDQIQKHPA